MNVSKSFMRNFGRAAAALTICLLTLTSAFAFTNAAHNLLPENAAANALGPTAVFKKCWVEYNVTEEGRKGMRVHVNFEVTGLKGVDSKLVARVQKEDGDFLTSRSSYSNAEGQLETSFSLKPGYATSVYEDAAMFLPYSELTLRKGVWNLKLDIDLNYEDGELIQHLAFEPFEFTAPNYAAAAADSEPESSVSAKVDRVWIDYNVFEGKRKGMRIHVSFEVTGLKDTDAKLVARIQKEDNSFLTSETSFSNASGQLQLAFEIRPGYATTVYKDATMFLPYDEIVIRKGVWNFKLDIDLNDADDELIQHLEFYEFEFTR